MKVTPEIKQVQTLQSHLLFFSAEFKALESEIVIFSLYFFLQNIKRKIKSDPYTQSFNVDLSNHSTIAKMLIQHQDKMSYKDLREGE